MRFECGGSMLGGWSVGVQSVFGERWAFLNSDLARHHRLGGAARGRQDDGAAGLAVGEIGAEEAGLGGDEHGVGHR